LTLFKYLIEQFFFSDSADIANTIDVQSNGVIRLRGSLTVFEKSFDFKVLLTDDGSSCDASGNLNIKLYSFQIRKSLKS